MLTNLGVIAGGGGMLEPARVFTFSSTCLCLWSGIYEICLVGGGGSGGSAAVGAANYTNLNAAAGGGGGGFCLKRTYIPKDTVLTVTVGAGGAGVTSASFNNENYNDWSAQCYNGNSGGTTSVTGGGIALYAYGGGGGISTVTSDTLCSGGAGGGAAGGDINRTGGTGGSAKSYHSHFSSPRLCPLCASGGGGAAASIISNGGNGGNAIRPTGVDYIALIGNLSSNADSWGRVKGGAGSASGLNGGDVFIDRNGQNAGPNGYCGYTTGIAYNRITYTQVPFYNPIEILSVLCPTEVKYNMLSWDANASPYYPIYYWLTIKNSDLIFGGTSGNNNNADYGAFLGCGSGAVTTMRYYDGSNWETKTSTSRSGGSGLVTIQRIG